MSNRKKRKKSRPAQPKSAKSPPESAQPDGLYERASLLARQGHLGEARGAYEKIMQTAQDPVLRALACNDLAVLSAVRGDNAEALRGFEAALTLDTRCEPARLNRDLLLTDRPAPAGVAAPAAVVAGPSAQVAPSAPKPAPQVAPVRVAVLSFLFNWPSTGGGIVHTVELIDFLRRAGYDVRHVYCCYAPWEIGIVTEVPPFDSVALAFDEASWTLANVQARYREAVDAYRPDYVLLTDSWNIKPLLAEAVRGYPYFLRLQALECLCPLNNVRLLPEPNGQVRQCHLHQLATPDACVTCLRERQQFSGPLHRAERDFSGVGTPVYREKLFRAFAEAEGVLVVNPLSEAMVSPYCRQVKVITAGMDPARFPTSGGDVAPRIPGKQMLLFAGLVSEWMKGFHVLHEACTQLWRTRQDFELVATANPPQQQDAFTRYVGWQSQAGLPQYLRAADVLVMPTIAQDALGRTAVEAMAAAKPVVASRLGGLPFTVVDGATGLLFEPGNAEDLATKLTTLLDDADLRRRLGEAGRRRFEEHYAWPIIIERHYRPLLCPRTQKTTSVPTPYRPNIPDVVDLRKLQDEAARFFGLPQPTGERLYRDYRALHERSNYATLLGEFKTLCFEEAFVLYALLSVQRPPVLIEVGTQHGKSARRLLDMRQALGLNARLVCFDMINEVRHFRPGEAELIVHDLTGRFRAEVLDVYPPGFIFGDIHSHALLTEMVTEVLADRRGWSLALHDCGRGLCNPHMDQGPDDPNVTSLTGVWHRHVLAAALGITDPLDPGLDDAATVSHRLHIFNTPHGLAVLTHR